MTRTLTEAFNNAGIPEHDHDRIFELAKTRADHWESQRIKKNAPTSHVLVAAFADGYAKGLKDAKA